MNAYEDGSDLIAIIGSRYRFPGITGDEDFIRVLEGREETISHFTREELLAAGVPASRADHPDYVAAKGVVPGIEYFDHEFFGVGQDRATLMDPQHRWFLQYAWQALEAAGYAPGTFEGRTGVFAGSAFNTYLLNNLRHADPALKERFNSIELLILTDKDFLATQTAYHLDLHGPAMTVQTACSTSLVAVHVASQSLLLHECDMALAGAVTLYSPQVKGYIYEKGNLISREGHVRSFDAEGEGTVYSSGIGIVVLKRLVDALADGDTVRAVIRGSAVNNDGARKGQFKAPSVEGIADVVVEALGQAGVDPETIAFVEANGSGTQWGDSIEIGGLTEGWRSLTSTAPPCGISAAKANVGHLNVAAGMASLIKAMLAVEHGFLPAAANFRRPNPDIDFERSPFYVVTDSRPWVEDGRPRRAAVNSYGVGGTNAHLILEQAPPVQAPPQARSWELLPVSARTAPALERMTAELAGWLEAHPEAPLADVAYTLQAGRRHFGVRCCVAAVDPLDAASALRALAAGPPAAGAPGSPDVQVVLGDGPAAALERCHDDPWMRPEVEQAALAVEKAGGPPLEALLAGEHGRPDLAAFAAGVALARLWRALFGEAVTLTASGAGVQVLAAVEGDLPLEEAARRTVEAAGGAHQPGATAAVEGIDALALAADGGGALYGTVAALWQAGRAVAWDGLAGRRRGRRIALPVYSFDGVRCYVDIPTAARPSNFDAAL